MSRRAYAALTAALCALSCLHTLAGRAEVERPGTERWTVKIGADADAFQVRPVRNNPVGELGRLVRLPRPASLPEDRRRADERGIYTVAATVTQFKLEKDGDYHVVLSDRGQTMIAEIPDPAFCEQSRWKEQITESRRSFDARYRVTGRFRYVKAPALITGVLFFDFNHHQAGVAPNAVELHPVLAITWSGTSSGYQPALRERHRPKQHRKATPPRAASGSDVMVWVNTASGVYHYPGSRWYGKTKEGRYMPEGQARAEGDRPAENGQ